MEKRQVARKWPWPIKSAFWSCDIKRALITLLRRRFHSSNDPTGAFWWWRNVTEDICCLELKRRINEAGLNEPINFKDYNLFSAARVLPAFEYCCSLSLERRLWVNRSRGYEFGLVLSLHQLRARGQISSRTGRMVLVPIADAEATRASLIDLEPIKKLGSPWEVKSIAGAWAISR